MVVYSLTVIFFLCFHKMGCSRKYLYPQREEIEEINNPSPPPLMDILYKFKTFFIRFPSPSLDRRNFLCGWGGVIEIIDIECVLGHESCLHFFRKCPFKSAMLNLTRSRTAEL